MQFNNHPQEDAEDAEDVALILVDPPVGPYSSPEEIKVWIKELEAMPQVPFVPESIEEAKRWLQWSVEGGEGGGST